MLNNCSRIRQLGLTILLFMVSYVVMAQRTISGKVLSGDNKQPLSGATITNKKSKTQALSDVDGNFKILAADGDVLVISNVGFANKEVRASDAGSIIELAVEQTNLQEIVVTALGIKKDVKRLGYSVQEVKGADLLKARESNPINGLVGKVAGLNVGINQDLLASPTVLLRGSPLNFYVVDGIPINSDTWNISPDDIETYSVLKGPTAAALYGSRGINGAILITTKRGKKNNKGFTVEVNSSTQINKGFIAIPKVQNEYGGGDNQQYAFGDYNSNGTGSGRNDKDYDVWGPRLDVGTMLPQYDGAYDPNQDYTITYGVNPDYTKFVAKPYTGHVAPTPWVSRGKNNLNNFLQAGLLTSNNISFSSVTDRSNIRMSVSNGYQRGVTPNTGLNSLNLNLIGSYDVTDKFKIEMNINYNRQFSKNVPDAIYGPNSIIYDVDIWTGADWNVLDPNIRNYWQPGKEGVQSNFVEYKRYQNPWFMSYEWLRSHYKNDMYGWTALTYKLNKNLDVMLRSNITTYNVLRTEKMPFSAHPYGEEHNHGEYREDRRDLWENNTDLLLRYNKENVGNSGISVSAFAGGSARNMKFTSSFTSTDQLIIPEVYTFANTLKPIRSYSYGSNLLMLSAYYSVDLTYKKYLTLTTTGRVDKTSALPVGHNTGFYPSFSASSPISDYVDLPKLITFLKIRGSYANVKDGGTAAYAGTSFQSLGVGSPLGYGNNYYTPYDGPNFTIAPQIPYNTTPGYNNQTQASAPNYLIANGIKPSSRSSYELGFDARFLSNRIGLSATYFQYKDGPKINPQYLSETSGLDYVYVNGGATKRTGAEVSLTGTPIQSKTGLRWDVMINWSKYKEVYTSFPGGVNEVSNGTGYPNHIGDRVDRLFGGVEAKTPDGKVIHDESGFPIYLQKAQYLGHADPDWSWSIHNKISYKSFSVSFQFDGMVGGLIQDYVLRKLTQGGRGANTAEGVIGAARLYESQHWQDDGYFGPDPAGTNDQLPHHTGGARGPDGRPLLGGDGVQVVSSDPTVAGSSLISYDPVTGVITNFKDLQFRPNDSTTSWVQDYVGSFYNDVEHTKVSKTYAKLREVVLTYALPAKLFRKTFISRIDVSLVGRNLLYFFPKKFHDIDVDQYPGRDQFGTSRLENDLQTPTTRSYGFNLNVVF